MTVNKVIGEFLKLPLGVQFPYYVSAVKRLGYSGFDRSFLIGTFDGVRYLITPGDVRGIIKGSMLVSFDIKDEEEAQLQYDDILSLLKNSTSFKRYSRKGTEAFKTNLLDVFDRDLIDYDCFVKFEGGKEGPNKKIVLVTLLRLFPDHYTWGLFYVDGDIL
ncbi:hypothetical protein [Porphyromonas somerae]|uniref:hypothetical protein n=1 Tax=Porphyromonas somerae TaxID=322095 RepID=UPI00035F1312|nr:hypothetical protein [Porphyromonas somerae]